MSGSRLFRGRLVVYLGSTAGAGKTYAMLRDAHALLGHGHDVVVAYVETYGRPRTIEMLRNLEVVPRAQLSHHGLALEDMDLEAVLARRPEVALVDELAHTNAPGLRHEKRWQDVDELRAAGIDVIATVNVQHVESVKDVAERAIGVPVRETLPDQVLDGASAVHFIDIAPEALRRRMLHGDIYPPERTGAALASFFRPRTLAALREIGLRLVADAVTPSGPGEAEDVVVAVACDDRSEELMRRAVRLARRTAGACVAVTVQASPSWIEQTRPFGALAARLGCGFAVLGGREVADVVIQAARDIGARHVLIGESAGGNWLSRVRPTIADRIIDSLPDMEVHVLGRGRRSVPIRAPERRPGPTALLRELQPELRRRGLFRVYLGYARGCGTTTAMLEEGRRRARRGEDVVVAAYRLHEDPDRALAGLEVLGGVAGAPRERSLEVEAVLARKPGVACIDDLAASSCSGDAAIASVPALLGAGITVLATLHLISVRSAIEHIGALRGRVPTSFPISDDLLQSMDELEVVDVPPDELLERVEELAILTPAQRAQALQGELRPSVLAGLRQAALRLSADHMDRQYFGEPRVGGGQRRAEVRSRIVLCLPPRRGLDEWIRRTVARAEEEDAELVIATVSTAQAPHGGPLDDYAALTHRLRGEFVRLDGRAVAATLARFIQESEATEVILGRRRRPWRPWGTTGELVRLVRGVDVHVMPRSWPGRGA